MNWEPYRWVLQDSILFRGLSGAQLLELLRDAQPPLLVKKGEAVYQPQAFRHALAVVLAGRLRVISSGGSRAILNTLTPGSICGVTAVFGEAESFVSEVTAAADAMLLFIRQEQLTAWFARCPQLAENYIRFLTDRIRFLNQRIATYTGGSSDGRLWRYLCAHRTADGSVQPVHSLCDLAKMLNIGRSSLYRSLDELETAGKIRREGKRIFVI